jgi:hypothetical protein
VNRLELTESIINNKFFCVEQDSDIERLKDDYNHADSKFPSIYNKYSIYTIKKKMCMFFIEKKLLMMQHILHPNEILNHYPNFHSDGNINRSDGSFVFFIGEGDLKF